MDAGFEIVEHSYKVMVETTADYDFTPAVNAPQEGLLGIEL